MNVSRYATRAALPAQRKVSPLAAVVVTAAVAYPVGMGIYLLTRSKDELDRMDNPGYCPEKNTGNPGHCPR